MQQRRRWGRWIGRLCGGALLLVVGLLGAEAAAQPDPRVKAHVSADSVKVGERFTLTLTATHATASAAMFPGADAGSGFFGDLHVFRRGPVQTRRLSDGRRVDSVAYDVTTFALDTARVAVLPIRVAAGGDTTVAGTPPGVVPVVSVVGSDADELRTPAALANFPRPPWVWGLLGLLTAAVLGGGAYAWRRWRARDDAEAGAAETTKSAYEAATARLERLGRRHPSGRAAAKAFYVDLTETLRVYLARRVGIRALEQTTPDVVAALRRRPDVPDNTVQRLRTVLEQADLVKFADARPSPAESQAVLNDAQALLDALEAAQRRREAASSDEDSPPTPEERPGPTGQ
jgi:hypothetical protein